MANDEPQPTSNDDTARVISRSSQYRAAKALPFELRQQCYFYLEEELYSQGIQLLNNLLTASPPTRPPGFRLPAFLPQPHVLALLATLTVHPSITTRTHSAERQQAADHALRYLNAVNSIVGATNAGFAAGFAFPHQDGAATRQTWASRRHASEHHEGKSPEQDDRLNSTYADGRSLWACADDFWHVVGWAFNCAAKYPMRWRRWELWVRFMVGVLEEDLEVRVERAKDMAPVAAQALLAESLIARYLSSKMCEGRTGRRRITRAILAKGDRKELAEFREIWKDETLPPKEPPTVKLTRKRKINIDEDDFGDYLEDVADDESEAKHGGSIRHSRSTSKSRPATPSSDNEQVDEDAVDAVESNHNDEPLDDDHDDNAATTPLSAYGPAAALALRQRLLALLTSAAHHLPPETFTPLEDLLDLYTEVLCALPLPLFASLLSPTTFPAAPLSFLAQLLLRALLPAAPLPTYGAPPLAQPALQARYLPHCASSLRAPHNARVSILCERLLELQLLRGEGLHSDSGALRRAVETGIAARKAKAGGPLSGARWKGEKGRARRRDEEAARRALERSAGRLLLLLEMEGL